MSRNIWIGVIIVVVLAAGGWWYLNQSSAPTTTDANGGIQPVASNQPSQPAVVTTQGPEILSRSDIQTGSANFNGQIQQAAVSEEDAPKDPLFQQYGTRTFTAFQKHPELVSSLKKIDPSFNPDNMGTSDLSSIVRFNGRSLLVLEGCFPHNCGGTEQLVALELSTGVAYLLRPTNVGPTTSSSGQFNLYGKPDNAIRAAMFSAYLQ